MYKFNALSSSKLSYIDSLEVKPAAHPHGTVKTFAWVAFIVFLTVIYFLIYNLPVSLHDVAHYVTAGVNQIRDQKDLLYPYNPYAPGGMGPAYEYFQDNSIHFDIRTNYPSKLYSTLYGLVFFATGRMLFLYAQWLTLAAIIVSNVFLYLIGSRFFKGVTLACFILSVALLPVMRFTLNPGSDIFGYLSFLFLLWASVCLRIKPFVVGLMAGIVFLFRAQLLSILIVLPLIISNLYGKKILKQVFVPLVLGASITYGIANLAYKILVHSDGNSNSLLFYINYFASSFYGLNELPVILTKSEINIINLFDKTQLFFLAYVLLICLSLAKAPFQKSFAIGGLLYLSVPVVIFSLDSTSLPHARYYITAIPMLMLSWFLAIKTLGDAGVVRAKLLVIATAASVCLSWYNVNGFPIRQLEKIDVISQRLRFLDFEGVEASLRNSFRDDDLIIINHAIPTGLSKLHNVIYLPAFEAFKRGDNQEIDGIIFVYSNQSPNDFFKPSDWMVNNHLPDEIKDDSGIVFTRIYAGNSEFPNFEGGVESEAYFYIYKNLNSERSLSRDSSGNRIFRVEAGEKLNSPRSSSPTFSEPLSWGPGFEKARAVGGGVIVGPGPNNSNVLYQRISVQSNEKLKVVARALGVDGASAKGRIQINWLDSSDNFIGTSLKVIDVAKTEQTYSALFLAPSNAKFGMMYVSPHGEKDVVNFLEMRLFGK
jgi:hypothetical protein